jgi:hypothetical protein
VMVVLCGSIHRYVCVREERGDGEGVGSQVLSLVSDGLRYINLMVVLNDWFCFLEFFGSESFFDVGFSGYFDFIYEYRCDERLKAKSEGSTCLVYTGYSGCLL